MAAVKPQATPTFDFPARIAEVQRELAESVAVAGLQRDPYGAALQAMGSAIGTFPEFVKHIEAARQPVRDEDLRKAVVQGVSRHAEEIVGSLNMRSFLLFVGCSLFLAVAMFGSGWWLSSQYDDGLYAQVGVVLSRTLTNRDAAQWLTLIEQNDIRHVERSCGQQNGREACAFSLWTTAPSAPQS